MQSKIPVTLVTLVRMMSILALGMVSLFGGALVLLAQPVQTKVVAVPPNDPDITYSFTSVVDHSFNKPVFVTHAGDARLFVVEQEGIIWIVQNDALLDTPFLDITELVRCCIEDNEEGLLGLAFEPNYASTGRFYIYYTNNDGTNIIAHYNMSADPNIADADSGITVMTIPHPPDDNHHGGWLGFGLDGNLYAGVGDSGGNGGDPFCTAQDPSDWHGKILRISVVGQMTYTIPSGNLFTAPQKPEVWAIGLRNPWRASFDRTTGDLFIADVGQDTWEEVNYAPAGTGAGINYGWSDFEGNHVFSDDSPCPSSGIPPRSPIAEYNRSFGCAVIGGYAYRGASYPWLNGAYFYGDLCNGWVWAAWQPNPGTGVFSTTEVLDTPYSITSFGEDASGELYLVDQSGAIYRLTSTYLGTLPTSTPTNIPATRPRAFLPAVHNR